MKTKFIIRTIAALALMAVISTSAGCKSKRGGSSGGCIGQIETKTLQVHYQQQTTEIA